ncbi:unnamed protein product [Paramecium pentaurelia]|uniref:Actin-related protein 8 n=1 Tax=Paramecium pentaurelia TaxID=43138 RepID=A0A8S1VP64_9CILI|nr:unnamed protein product [Paramecium pentaurelia]
MQEKPNQQQQDNVQNTIKSLQDKIQNIENLIERGSDCIIIQYGSHSIKMNKASEMLPKKFRNLIGYKVQSQPKQSQSTDLTVIDESLLLLEQKLIQKCALKAQPKSMRGKPRAKIEVDLRNIRGFVGKKEQKQPQCILAQMIEDKSVVFEDDIFTGEYLVRQPIKHGFFNLTDNYSIQDVIEDLYKLTLYGLSCKLEVKNVSDYYCILVIPDIFQRIQVKMLVDMLIRQLGFKGIYLHLESVLSSFGANLQQCCVVDIGYEKINITCVDDGVILPGTYVRKNFGSKDIDLVLMRQITKRNACDQTVQLQSNNYGDLLQMEKLKEKACQLTQKEDKLNYNYELHCLRNQKEKRFFVQHNDGLYISANTLFESEPFNEIRKQDMHECFDFTGRLFEMQYDPEDNFEELSGGIQLCWYWGSKEKEQQYFIEGNQMLNPNYMIPLDHMIAYSIAQVQDPEIRQKLANNILFTGGGAHLIDLVDEVEALLIEKFQVMELNEIERVEVKTIIRDVRPINMAWVGATVLPKTESVSELWITAARWLGNLEPQKDELEDMINQFDGDVQQLEKKLIAFAKKDKEKDRSCEYGLKHLKEKIPFIW